ncbi:MAG: exodeoxyribonuclease VII small subunit [Candidatus Fermentibacteraceae bacterium]
MSDKNEMTYEKQMEELTEIVDQIGREDCPVDELESRVRRAADLIRALRTRLSETEMAVTEVLEELDADESEKEG